MRVFFTSPSHLPNQIDGASTLHPRPAILVNLVSGGRCWWRTRMTLAPELAHILFDLEGDQRTLFSPPMSDWAKARTAGRWRICERFDDIEVEADKFAACLLAPRDEVAAVAERLDPTGDLAIAAVGERFGVGKVVAINRLQVCFGLSQEERQRMVERSEDLHWETHDFDADVVDEREGLRADALRDRAAPGDFGGGHAILVVDADGSMVTWLAPYYPRDGQPLTTTRERFLEMFLGNIGDVPIR